MFENLTHFNLHHRIAELNTPALVFFSSEGCGACRYLKASLSVVQEENPDWRIFEVDAQAEMGLTREFEVFHLPSLFLFLEGEYHSPLACEATPKAITVAVTDAFGKPAQEAP